MDVWAWIDSFTERQIAFTSAVLAFLAVLLSLGAMFAAWSQARSAKRTNELAEQLSAPAIDRVEAGVSPWEGWIDAQFLIKNQAIVRLQVPTIRCKNWGWRIVSFRSVRSESEGGTIDGTSLPPKGVRKLQYNGEVLAVKDKPYTSARVHLLLSEPVGWFARFAARSWSIIHRADTIALEVETKLMRTRPIITKLPVMITPPSVPSATQPGSVHQVINRAPNRWRQRSRGIFDR